MRALGRALGKQGSQGQGFYWFGRASEHAGQLGQALGYYGKAAESLPEDHPLVVTTAARIEELAEDEQPPMPNGRQPRRLHGRHEQWPLAETPSDLWP